MATAGEGTSYERGGGAGGKFRKRPFRRPQTTPYDRPPTSLGNPRNGWLSKLVDPASKLISASAHMFFSSVFRKRLPPPPQPSSVSKREPRDTNQGCEVVVPTPTICCDGGNPSNSSDSSGISELEQMLKQKTFTRSEIDRLTELLRSRTANLPDWDEDKGTDASLPKPVSAFERQEDATGPMQENGIEGHGLHRIVSTPVVSSRVLEEDVASPAELAKAYMGSRPSKVSPSMLSLHSQVLREDASLLNSEPFPPKSPIMSLAPKSAVRIGVPENCLITPRSHGRSAIYSMARTPYIKGAGSTNDGYGGASSLSSQGAWEHDGRFGSKQVALKRRSSVLDDDIGSGGPIRRIRQKPNLLSCKNLSLPVSGSPLSRHAMGIGSDAHISSTQKLLLLDESKYKVSKMIGEVDNSTHATSFALVPSKSTEMATKILQHLEKMTPKEKSSESKLAAARNKSPAKLTPSMLSGKARRSLEHVDSSKFLQNAQDSRKLEDMRNTSLPDARDSTSQKQDKVEENGPKTFVIPGDILGHAVNNVDTVSVKDSVPSFKNADSATTNFVAQPPLKKRAFRMSAHEDFVELDDDVHSNGDVSILSAEERDKLEMPVVENKALATEAVTENKSPALSDIKPPAGSELNKRTDLETNDGSVAGEKRTSFTFPTAPAPSTTLQPAVLTSHSSSEFDKIVPPKEPNVPPPLFSFGSKNDDKIPPFKFSPSSSVSEFSGPNSIPLSASKLESSNSFANVASGATDAVQKILKSDRGDDKNTKKAEDVKGKSETVVSSAVSTSTSTSSIFSFGAPANNSSLSNGSLASSPYIFSSSTPVPPSSNLVNQNFTKSSPHVASATTTDTITSTSSTTTPTASSNSLTTSATDLGFTAAPIFRFGSSVAPSTSVSTISSTSGLQSTDSKANIEKETTFANLASSPFGGTSSAMASTGSSIFGFSASATSSTVNNQPQGSLFGTGSGSLVDVQASSAGTGVATVTQTMPVQFGSSAPSPVFGSTGTTFTSSSSLFGSSTSAAKLLSSGTTFGLASAVSSSEINSVSSSTNATSSLFGSSWQPSKSSIFGASSGGSLFNSPSPSTGFSFGASATSVAATNNAPSVVFGSSTGASSGSFFSFTSAAANPSSLTSLSQTQGSQTQPVFGNSLSAFTTSGNSDQMNMEDSMAEDTVPASTPAVPVFGQPPISPPSGFMYGSPAPSAVLPFQFGGQQNQATSQNPSPFPASGSLDFGAGGSSFSLGTGDKSNRKMVRVKHKNRKK
uniref:Putative nuclear pore complex protein NUP1 n=1 Tax=Davidia involucrata TaxID=16924 RepID=A0A5B6ZE27_DAVIN